MAQAIDYKLTEPEAELLRKENEEVHELAGELGGVLGSEPGWANQGGKAGAAGGRFGARFARPRSAAATVDVAATSAEVHERAHAAMSVKGKVIPNPNGVADGSVWGIVLSGWGNLIPALVRIDVEPTAGGCRVHVRATGREPLIKQKVAPKAVDRVVEAVSGGTVPSA